MQGWRNLGSLLLSGFAGGAIVLAAQSVIRASQATSQVIANELIIVDNNKRKVASLSSDEAGAVLQFFDKEDGKVAISMKASPYSRQLLFFGENGNISAALNSVPPQEAATLYLGDRSVAARIILGALQSDVEVWDKQTTPPAGEWGLVFRNPRSLQTPLMRLFVDDSNDAQPPRVGALLPSPPQVERKRSRNAYRRQ